MKKFKILSMLVFMGIASFLSCKKKQDGCSYDPCAIVIGGASITEIEEYLQQNSITATGHCSGVFYKINKEGVGRKPNICSFITVKYKGQLKNGTVFDQQDTSITFNLSYLIPGWKNILLLMSQGASYTLYIPPALGYGSQQQEKIPANSMLIFDVELVKIED